ncbi:MULTISPECIES: acetylglutamate kinase [unclassified Streptomyces]|uniref:acetylglutamate kinase n=1 Tax=unclassified Streptomyces TaxID=2593676 RepID=UPI00036CC4E9|nr:acetylglutamate kinase [Streptomyces sp. BoleA5]MYX36833.1 acetylglutamate kinase [Streptomyces sp. SID8377]
MTAALAASGPLPALRVLGGRTVVVKVGGNAMGDGSLLRTFAQDVVRIREAGVRVVVVHGGGPQISAQLDLVGIEARFVGGLRVTTPEVLDVVRMVLAGKVQRDLVGLLNEHGPYAVGLTGEDAHTLTAVRRYAEVDGEIVDIGLVGEVTEVNTAAVDVLLEHGHIPVVSSLGRGTDGQIYNVNADAAAGALAAALDAEALVVLTDVPGLYADWPRRERVLDRLTAAELEAMLPLLGDGMVPKMESCLRAVRAGVRSARVLDGRAPHALLGALTAGPGGAGTTVLPA